MSADPLYKIFPTTCKYRYIIDHNFRKSRGKNCKTGQRMQCPYSSGACSVIGVKRQRTDLRGANREVLKACYGKRQTAKIKLLPFLFSCVYSGVKLFVLAMNCRRRYSIFVCFVYGLEEKNSKSEVIFAICRLPLTSCLTSLIKTSMCVISEGLQS